MDPSKQPQPVQRVSLSIQVPASPQTMAYLEANKGTKTVGERLANFVAYLIEQQAGGGLMLTPADMDYLATINKGVRFQTSRDVVKSVEVALRREEGQYSFTIQVDPTLVEPLKECAEFQDLTAQQLLEMVVNQCLQNGWAYEFVPENGRMVPLDEGDVETAQRVLGSKNFTGREIGAALKRLEALEKAKPAQAAA